MKGMKNLLRYLEAWKMCRVVVVKNRMMKTAAAASEGWYLEEGLTGSRR
jgi:hypothetical protein